MKKYDLRDNETKTIEQAARDLTNITKEKEISEDTLRSLSNVISELRGLKENLYWRFLREARRGSLNL